MKKQIEIISFGILVLFTSLLVIINTHFVTGQENGSNHTVEIDPEVFTALNGSEWIQAIIDIDSKDSIDNITLVMPKTDFKFIHEMMSRTAFVAEINKQGLESLINNTHVNKISWDRVAYIVDGKTKNESSNETKIESKKVEFQKINWWLIVVVLVVFLVIIWVVLRKKK